MPAVPVEAYRLLKYGEVSNDNSQVAMIVDNKKLGIIREIEEKHGVKVSINETEGKEIVDIEGNKSIIPEGNTFINILTKGKDLGDFWKEVDSRSAEATSKQNESIASSGRIAKLKQTLKNIRARR